MPEPTERTDGKGPETPATSIGLLDELSMQVVLEGVDAITSGRLIRLAACADGEGRIELADEAGTLGRILMDDASRCRLEWLDRLRELYQRSLGPSPDDPPALQAAAPSALAADPEMIDEFVTEAREHLATVEKKMLVLENDGSDAEAINEVFRAFHTIKGLSGFLELTAIQQMSHEIETLLDSVRTGTTKVAAPIVDAVFAGMDFVASDLQRIERQRAGGNPEPSAPAAELIQRIRTNCKALLPNSEPEKPSQPEIPEAAREDVASPAAAAETKSTATTDLPVSAPSAPAASAPANGQPTKRAGIFEERRAFDNASIRIETAKLDHLLNMVGEMVIAQTSITHNPLLAGLRDSRLMADLALLARTTADVQKVTTAMRMVPIGVQFQKTARLVRDLSRQLGKQITMSTSGDDTELDKTIAEELADPLMHMVRNSIDHGIESVEERQAAGKDPMASIRLAAYHQSSQIVIEISDDGRGLNREKILGKAVERGLIKSGSQLSDNEAFLLIFEPGFSTADTITGISGRGVGMDVVKEHVQKLRGQIDIQSEKGKGTTFFLRLPLTLAIIEGLVVAVGSNRYIIPLFSIREMLHPDPNLLSTVQAQGEMATVRGSLLPVVRLHRRFNLEPRSYALAEGILVICVSHGKQFCLFVDDLIGKQEVVIKSLGDTFKNVVGLAGCAILADGRVGLILDVDGIYRGKS
jgi:two-component system chemotaxis sensor kinase CheA